MERPLGDRERALGTSALAGHRLGTAAVVGAGWALLLYLLPLGVGLAVGAVPLHLVSSGIFFDQSATSMAGYRAILWAPIIAGVGLGLLGMLLRPTRLLLATGLVGCTVAATFLVVGGGLGIGPAGTILLGTDLRWIWRLCLVAAGLVSGLLIPVLLRTRAEEHAIDFRALRTELLLSGVLFGALLVAFGPGPLLGKILAAIGSWLGSLVWIVGV